MLRRTVQSALLAIPLVVVAACVTINVYFPEAAAERAADRIIEEVWGPERSDGAEDDRSWKRHQLEDEALRDDFAARSPVLLAALRVLDAVVSPAHAQADLDIDTPEIRALTDSMNRRFRDLKPLFDAGAIGLTSDAMIEIRDRNAVPLAQRSQLSQLVAAENADRNRLYAAIATANGHPEWEDDIRRTFAQRWIARASSGWYYRDGSGAWQQKR